MKCTITNLPDLKRLVTSLQKLGTKSSLNEAEKCTKLVVKDDILSFTIFSSSLFQLTASIPVSSSTEGECYIYTELIINILKRTPASKASLVLESDANSLTFNVPGLGKIKEGLFHNQQAFKYLDIDKEDQQAIKLDIIPYIVEAAKLVDASSYICIKLKPEVIYIIGNLSVSNQVLYKIPSPGLNTEKTIYFKGGTIRNICSSIPNNSLLLVWDSYLEIGGSNSEYNLHLRYTETHTESSLYDQYENLDNIPFNEELTVPMPEFLDILEWQTYNYKTGDAISLETVSVKGAPKHRLIILGDSMEEGSEVEIKGNLNTPLSIQVENIELKKLFNPKKNKNLFYIKTKSIPIQDLEVSPRVIFFIEEAPTHSVFNITYGVDQE